MSENNVTSPFVYQRGFIAVMATIIISLILIGTSLSQSKHAFSVRSQVLDRELKKTASFVSYGCREVVLKYLADNYDYTPGSQGEFISVGRYGCTILKVEHDSEDAQHGKLVTVFIRGQSKDSYVNTLLSTYVQNPQFHRNSSPKVISSQEVISFP